MIECGEPFVSPDGAMFQCRRSPNHSGRCGETVSSFDVLLEEKMKDPEIRAGYETAAAKRVDPYEGKSWQELRNTIAEYESAIGFETNCTNCARMLDLQHDLEARMDQAKKLARRVEGLQSDYTRLPGVNGERVADLLSDDSYNLGHELRGILGDL